MFLVLCIKIVFKKIYTDVISSNKHKQSNSLFCDHFVVLRRTFCFVSKLQANYLELVYLVTALVPSETACLANSPGRRSLTAV